MIICGYQGIGKSTASCGNGFIDLESGNFFVDGERSPDQYIPYCNIALSLSEQGNVVFLSSHMVVRDYLASLPRTEEPLIICPSLELEYQWVDRLKKRYEDSKLDKDYRAYMNAVDRYSENIQELMNQEGFTKLIIKTMDYDLIGMIKEYKKRQKTDQ